MNTGQPDAIEMKENDAYGRPQPTQQEITVEENPAYDLGPNSDSNPTSTPCRLYVFIIAGCCVVAQSVHHSLKTYNFQLCYNTTSQ